jgi:hypothetical protein
MVSIIKKFKEFRKNKNETNTRIFIIYDSFDGFGNVVNIYLKSNGEKIGSMIFRLKTYLENRGYPEVLELHIGFKEKYQGKRFFQDSLIELLNVVNIPIYISKHRVINKNVFKAISKLNETLLEIVELPDLGYIITKRS